MSYVFCCAAPDEKAAVATDLFYCAVRMRSCWATKLNWVTGCDSLYVAIYLDSNPHLAKRHHESSLRPGPLRHYLQAISLENCNCWQVDSTYRAIKMHCKSLTVSCHTWALNGNFKPGWKAVHYCPLLLKVSTSSPSCDVTVYWHTKQYTWALQQQSEKRSTKKKDSHNICTIGQLTLAWCTAPDHTQLWSCVLKQTAG